MFYRSKCLKSRNFRGFAPNPVRKCLQNPLIPQLSLTYYSPVLLFYTPWKYQKTFRFSDIFRGYRKATPGCNGLNSLRCSIYFSSGDIYKWHVCHYPTNIYLFRVRNTSKRYEISSKLTIETPERRHWRRSGVLIVNFEHILHLF